MGLLFGPDFAGYTYPSSGPNRNGDQQVPLDPSDLWSEPPTRLLHRSVQQRGGVVLQDGVQLKASGADQRLKQTTVAESARRCARVVDVPDCPHRLEIECRGLRGECTQEREPVARLGVEQVRALTQ